MRNAMFSIGDKVQVKQGCRGIFTRARGKVSVIGTYDIEVVFDVPIKATDGIYTGSFFRPDELDSIHSNYTGMLSVLSSWLPPLQSQNLPQASAATLASCDVSGHRWTRYTGLTEAYDFCDTKGCDKKRPLSG